MEVWAAARVRAHVWETETVFVTRDTRASCVRTVLTDTTEKIAPITHSHPAQVTVMMQKHLITYVICECSVCDVHSYLLMNFHFNCNGTHT